MNLFRILLVVAFMPLLLFSQQSKWSIEGNLGGNLSFNKMYGFAPNSDRFMTNSVVPGGAWSILLKYRMLKKSYLIFGFDHSSFAFKYNYVYYEDNRYIGGAGGGSSVFIAGFPIVIENKWVSKNKFSFSTGSGIMYKLNFSGLPFLFSFKDFEYNESGELVYYSELYEYDAKQNDHLISLFAYTTFEYIINDKFYTFLKISYNQGVNQNSSLWFTAKHVYPQQDYQTIKHDYHFYTNGSYLSYGIGLNYTFNKLKKNRDLE